MALRKNDPYNEMDSGHEGIRPSFLGGSGDTEEGVHGLFRKDEGTGRSRAEKRAARIEAKAAEKDAASSAAAEDLEGAEEGASGGGLWRGGDNLDETQDAEEEANGFYSGSGKDANKKKLKAKKSKLSFLKRGGPSFGILGFIVAIGGLMGGMQSLMPFAIEEMIIEKFNSIGISSTIASDAWLNTQLNYGVRIGNTITNEPENLFAFSHFQVQQFEGQGIKVVEGIGTENTSITALLYLKNNEYIPVVGSDFIQYESLVPAIKTASGLDNIGTPVQAKDALTDPAFKVPYTTASKAWRGGGSGWFDNIMSKVTEAKLNLTRNRWVSVATTGVQTMKQEFRRIAKEQGKIRDDGVNARGGTYTTTTGEDGSQITTVDHVSETESVDVIRDGEVTNASSPNNTSTSDSTDGAPVDVSGSSISEANTRQKIYDVLNSKAVKAASTGATIGCAILKGLISIYNVVSAQQKLQFLNLISGFLEAVDKVKAGDDGSGPMNQYSDNLTAENYTLDDNGNKVSETKKSAMQSAGIAWLFGAANVIGSNDPSVRNINFESIMSDVNMFADDIALTTEVYSKCGYAKAAIAVIDLASTVISVATFGVGGALKILWEAIVKPSAKAAIKVAVLTAIQVFIPIAVNQYAKMALNDVATEWFGEDLGNALVSGANSYLGGNGGSGGQGGGSESKVGQYLGERDTVIAEEGEYQRAIRSPFDITSRHTFLGSLAHSVLPLAYSNGFMRSLSSLSNLASSSIVKITPIASAADLSATINNRGDCDLANSVGAVADAFCNPYIITDTSTITTSPVAVTKIVDSMYEGTLAANTIQNPHINSDNFLDDGSINPKSDLAKYITYCGQRTSQYGLYDAAIAAKIVDGDSVVERIIGFVPVINDFQNIITGWNESDNDSVRYITGEACVASDDDYWMNENRWFQRYAENQRLLENMNPGYKSEVTAFLEDYYEKNPLDQSFEGTLARFSGMTKDQVEDTLALMEYYQFLDEYDPSERLAFVEPKETKEIKFDNDYELAQVFYVLTNQISYNDIRNRTFAV